MCNSGSPPPISPCIIASCGEARKSVGLSPIATIFNYSFPFTDAAFASSQSEKVRDRAYRDYLQFLSVHRSHPHARAPEDETARQNWIKEHPLGYFEYRDAIGPSGKYGRWLRDHHTIVQIGDGLFVHGGLNPTLQFRSIDALDKQVRSELANFDVIWQLLSDKQLIWRYMGLQEALQQIAEELKLWLDLPNLKDHEASPVMRALLGLSDWMAVSSEGPLWLKTHTANVIHDDMVRPC